MKHAIPFPDLLPVSVEEFLDEYLDKKMFIVKNDTDRFRKHFSWEEFENYLNGNGRNGHQRMPQLQIISDSGRYCHKKSKRKINAARIHEHWWSGQSFILTICEFLNKTMWEQCEEFEKYFEGGQANLYCSNKAEAKCFPIHSDTTDNFLFHVRGKVRWYIYNEFGSQCKPDEATLNQVVDLDEGDLLYLPRKLYHKAEPLSPRISISFHFNQPEDWTKGRKNKRQPWLDFTSGIREEVDRVLKNSS